MSTRATRVRWLPALPYVFGFYALRVLVGVIATHPFVALAKRMLGGWPEGDRMLYEPGGLMLSELMRLHGAAISGLVEQSALFALAMVPVGMVASAVLLSALAALDPRDVPSVLATAVRHFVPVAFLTIVQLIGVGGSIFMAFVVREGAASALRELCSPRTSDLLSGIVLFLGFIAACVFVVVTDTARAAVVRSGLDTAQASVHAVSVLKRRAWPLATAFSARFSAALFVATVALAGTAWIGLAAPARALTMVTLQQAALLTMACLHVSWLARAMALSAPVEDGGAAETYPRDGLGASSEASSDRFARSDGQTGPTPDRDS